MENNNKNNMTKKQYLTELKNIVKRAIKEVDTLTKKNKFKVFEHSPHYEVYSKKLIIPENSELNSGFIFLNAVDHYPVLPSLFPYTKEELDNIKKNDAQERIAAYEKSIKMHQDLIGEYKKEIEVIKKSSK